MTLSKEFPQRPFLIKEGLEAQLEQRIGEWKELRNKIHETIPSKEGGVDIQRVHNFLAEMNIPVRDYIFITDADILIIKKLCEQYHVAAKLFEKENWIGVYFGELDLVLVNRDRCYEAENDAILTEGIYVHEQAHASSSHTPCAVVDGRVEQTRIGFSVGAKPKAQGSFFEEGWVDMVRAKYMEKHMPDKTKQAIFGEDSDIEEVSLDKVIINIDAEDFDITQVEKPAKAIEYPLAAKYFHATRDGEGISNITPAPAGFGIELLCRQKPELFELLSQARGDVSKLREVPKIINGISPELYPRLRQLEYTEENFARGLKMIINEVYEGGV